MFKHNIGAFYIFEIIVVLMLIREQGLDLICKVYSVVGGDYSSQVSFTFRDLSSENASVQFKVIY